MSEILWCADNGDGTYRNPVLYCDYSDPDAICVNGTYYLTASTFNYVPGLPILTSRDLVNWKLRNYAVKNIPEARYAAPQHAQGIWAPAIRFQNGRFYIYYGMPDEGIYMVSTENPLGDWDNPVLVKPGKGLIDPCPFWDDDGRAYIIHGYAKSRIGFKSWLGIFPISPDGRTALGDDHLLYDGTKKHPTIEGPKVHKRGGWYYIFAPAGGVATGWQVCLRSRSIFGPYETQVVLKQGSSETNGPHQGAWVETPEGEHWFLHFQSRGLYGRVTHLQPMTWQADGWPYIGIPDETPVPPDAIAVGEECAEAAPIANAEDCGIAVETYRKPKAPECEPSGEIGDDDFSGALGLQWQFMGNWQPDFYEVGGGKLPVCAETARWRQSALAVPADADAENCVPGVLRNDDARCGAFAGGRTGGRWLRRRTVRLHGGSADGKRRIAAVRDERWQRAHGVSDGNRADSGCARDFSRDTAADIEQHSSRVVRVRAGRRVSPDWAAV